MKKIIIVITAIVFCISGFAQSPQKFSYQAVIRDNNNNLVTNAEISMIITILHGSSDGMAIYTNSIRPSTNANGLISIEIGDEASFNSINWANGPFFIKTEFDPSGGSNYSVTAISQLLSVPYALHAKSVENIPPIEYNTLLNKPQIPSDLGELSDNSALLFSGDYKDLTNSPELSAVALSSDYKDLINAPELSAVALSGDYKDLINSPELSAVALSGDFKDLSNIPDLADVALSGSYNDLTNSPALSTVAISGQYNDLTGKPTSISDFNLNANSQRISNLADPVHAKDASTKAYVDELIQQVMNTFSGDHENFTSLTTGTISDIDGNTYNIVKIGNQWWMAENLKTTKYANGEAIPNITVNTTWNTTTEGAWSYYNNDTQYNNSYGKLYNWHAVADSRNLCPAGWHVPTDVEWTVLTDLLGGLDVAGGKLKDKGTTYWNTPNTNATNEVGFTARAGGWRITSGSFSSMGNFGRWWTSTQYDATRAWYRHAAYDHERIIRNYLDRNMGYAVRCVRN